jgi:hypothetical protein
MSRVTISTFPHPVIFIGTLLLLTQGCGGTGADLPQLNQQTTNTEATGSPANDSSDPSSPNNTSTGANSDQPQITQNTAVLSWLTPDMSADGTPLTDLLGFRVYYDQTAPLSKETSQQIAVGDLTTYTVSGLQSGLYYFAVTAIDILGNESDFSETVSKSL